MKPNLRVYDPAIQVRVIKTVQRKSGDGGVPFSERFQGTQQVIDLSPYLGDGSSVRTTKNLREPAGGFSITIMDRPYKNGFSFETLYGLIEPMDMVEIRMRQSPGFGLLPIIMRGFISDVRRNESIGGDGRPQRTVTISGQDYGKVWQIIQILYFIDNRLGQELLTAFSLSEKWGVGAKNAQKASDFFKEVVTNILNPYLKNLIPENLPVPSEFKMDRIVVQHGTMSVQGPQQQTGTIYELLRRFGDVGIWNELFVEDQEDGVYVVYRPNPSLSLEEKMNGKVKTIQDDAEEPVILPLLASDVVSISIGRSDSGVANFYWVRAPRFELNSDIFSALWARARGDKTTVNLEE